MMLGINTLQASLGTMILPINWCSKTIFGVHFDPKELVFGKIDLVRTPGMPFFLALHQTFPLFPRA
jgi:hypothetical protein